MTDWAWSVFLGRAPAEPTAAEARAAVAGRCVLITGAGGSIGTGLAEAVLTGDPRRVILADSSEHTLYEIHRACAQPRSNNTQVIPVLGDLLDPALLAHTFAEHAPDLVFHTAAYKHVPLLETNPFAAMRNNAAGTLALARAVAACADCQLVLLSTDKAVEPASVMGASKRIAELAVLAHSAAGTPMCAVRLANVLASSGSVVPLFAEQIARGEALTITDPEARRALMTRGEATRALLLAAATRHLSGRILIPDCSEPVRVLDLARHMLDRASRPADAVEIIGLRPGERLTEKMTSAAETLVETLPNGLRVYRSPYPSAATLERIVARIDQTATRYDHAAMSAAVHELVPEYPCAQERP